MCMKCDKLMEDVTELINSKSGRIRFGNLLLTLAKMVTDDLEDNKCTVDKELDEELRKLVAESEGAILPSMAVTFLERLVGRNGWPSPGTVH